MLSEKCVLQPQHLIVQLMRNTELHTQWNWSKVFIFKKKKKNTILPAPRSLRLVLWQSKDHFRDKWKNFIEKNMYIIFHYLSVCPQYIVPKIQITIACSLGRVCLWRHLPCIWCAESDCQLPFKDKTLSSSATLSELKDSTFILPSLAESPRNKNRSCKMP